MVRYRTAKNQHINTIKTRCSMSSTVSTQVEDLDISKGNETRITQPYVVIQKLEDQLPQLFRKSKPTPKPAPKYKIVLVRKNVDFQGNEKPRYTIIRRITSGMSMSASYNTFVQPITNNKNVNSTLDDAIENINPSPQGKKEKPKLKRKFYRPGPKCFKEKWIKLQENENKNLDSALSPITEVSDTKSIENYDRILSSCKRDIGVQTEEYNENENNNENNVQESETEGDEVVLNNDNDEKSRYSSYANITAVVASRSQENSGSSSTFSLNDGVHTNTEYGFATTKQKYIKISAKTVHIHNHFFD